MRIKARSLQLAALLSIAFASTSLADLVGSTYTFSDSTTGGATITDTGAGSYTDPANASFCVGPNANNCLTSGLEGSFDFADSDPTNSTITFDFTGSTFPASRTFSIDLGDFVTTDGSIITDVTYASGNLISGDFSTVTWTGTDAVFLGTSFGGGWDAFGGSSVVFDVTLVQAPEPESFTLLGIGLLCVSVAGRRWTKPA